jgi:hypothetical protein
VEAILNSEHVLDETEATAEHFAALAIRRQSRERRRVAFLEKASRTSLKRRRWFRISDIEPNSVKRKQLTDHWRAQIYSGDLLLKGKSQVMCLSSSPLLNDHRLPPELARREHFFNVIVDDLWMSVPRWLQLFKQVAVAPPSWMPGPARKNQKPKKLGRPAHDWSPARKLVFQLMDHHGEFDPTDAEWNAQARLEQEISMLPQYQHAAESTIRSNVGRLLSEWRAHRAQR